MRNLKFIFTAAALAIALVLPMAGWADDGGDGNRATTTYEIIHQETLAEWLYPLNHEQCSAIPRRFGTINPDSSDRVAQIARTVRANGSKQIDVFDVVTGTAASSGGDVSGPYIWVYENHAIYDVPQGGGPVKISVRVLDRFRLIGQGLNMEFSFDWGWRFRVPSGSAFDPGLDFNGVTFPDDPVNPTNVLNFKAFSTMGELACDPL